MYHCIEVITFIEAHKLILCYQHQTCIVHKSITKHNQNFERTELIENPQLRKEIRVNM